MEGLEQVLLPDKMFLEAINLKKSFKNKVAVNGVSLKIYKGEIVGLLGPNGAGKTTTFYMMVGFLKPDEGKVLLNGEELNNCDVSQRAQKGILYLPQESSVFRKLTVEENFKIVMEKIKEKIKDKKNKNQVLKEKLEYYLELFNLKSLLNQKAYNLSGGEKRKVEIVRALLVEPNFIFLDEPFAGIDPIGISQLKEIFKTLKNQGIGLLISDHNVRDTLKVCDRGYVIAEGVIIGEGTPEELLENSLVKKKYLGETFNI